VDVSEAFRAQQLLCEVLRSLLRNGVVAEG
jgi:hypothetical protein